MCECFSPDDPTTGGGGLALGRCEFVKGVVLIKGPHARECMGVKILRCDKNRKNCDLPPGKVAANAP